MNELTREIKQLTGAQEIAGKQIVSAVVRTDEVVLNLGNGEFFHVVPAVDCEGTGVLKFHAKCHQYSLHEAGVITEKEKLAIDAAQRVATEKQIRERELRELRRLQLKYTGHHE